MAKLIPITLCCIAFLGIIVTAFMNDTPLFVLFMLLNFILAIWCPTKIRKEVNYE